MSIKVKFWVYISDGQDGSAFPHYFSSAEAAEAYASKDDQRFCDDILCQEFIVDDNGNIVDGLCEPRDEEDEDENQD
jgi:hypothetical protein